MEPPKDGDQKNLIDKVAQAGWLWLMLKFGCLVVRFLSKFQVCSFG